MQERVSLTKKTLRATERDAAFLQEKRQIFISQLESIPEENKVYIDEAGSNLAMTPVKAWAMKNHRAYDARPPQRGGNLSLVGALKKSGMQALYPENRKYKGPFLKMPFYPNLKFVAKTSSGCSKSYHNPTYESAISNKTIVQAF